VKELMNELAKVYNKGFSSGFYLGQPTPKDFATIEHSAATEKKHFVGKVNHYYPKIKVATIKLVSELNVGDKIAIIGKTTGILDDKIEYMESKKKSVKEAKKTQEIGIKLKERVRKNDEVYVIKKV
ncbi:MAG: U32 family peptidase, partial [Nanoarchaeota archaeon]